MAEVLRAQGSIRALVVHSADGMDELSIAAPSFACELSDGALREFVIEPHSLGIEPGAMNALKVANAGESLALVRAVLGGAPGPASEIVTLNAAAGLYVAGQSSSLGLAVQAARDILQKGLALQCFERFVALTNS
jgi:anthranilate phosphoribosyltransferase